MSFTLYVQKDRWFAHQQKLEELYPDYLPVIKGNGYGFGNSYLAAASWELGKKRVAVGTLEEARKLLSEGFAFEEILVLTPVLADLRPVDLASCLFTVGSVQQLEYLIKTAQGLAGLGQTLPAVKIVLKCQSPMLRYGFSKEDLDLGLKQLYQVTNQVQVEIRGASLHFPVTGLADRDKLAQVTHWIDTLARLGTNIKRFYLSHVSPELLHQISRSYPTIRFNMRLGTLLWLNATDTYYFRSTVMAVQAIRRGQNFGYKQKKAWRSGHILYVAGGSANGIGLDAPVHQTGLKGRLKLTAFWLLNLFNLNLSPYVYQGRRLWFAEPPHMQVTALRLPAGINPPAIGSEIALRNIRMTIASFDRIVELAPENQPTPVFSQSTSDSVLTAIAGLDLDGQARVPAPTGCDNFLELISSPV